MVLVSSQIMYRLFTRFDNGDLEVVFPSNEADNIYNNEEMKLAASSALLP